MLATALLYPYHGCAAPDCTVHLPTHYCLHAPFTAFSCTLRRCSASLLVHFCAVPCPPPAAHAYTRAKHAFRAPAGTYTVHAAHAHCRCRCAPHTHHALPCAAFHQPAAHRWITAHTRLRYYVTVPTHLPRYRHLPPHHHRAHTLRLVIVTPPL